MPDQTDQAVMLEAMRGAWPKEALPKATHCKRGHALIPSNLAKNGGRTTCLQCKRARLRGDAVRLQSKYEWLLNAIKSKRDDKCIEWPFGMKGPYGFVRVNGRGTRAHRAAYEMVNGPIGDGLLIRHLCNNPRCVNPEHLATGTHLDNAQDYSKTFTHCRAGHPRTPENTYVQRAVRRDGSVGHNKSCRVCAIERSKARWRAEKASRQAIDAAVRATKGNTNG